MNATFRAAGSAVALLALIVGTAAAQKPPKSVLLPVVPHVKAVVRQVQPQASFGSGHDILIGQYRTANYTIHPRDKVGRKLPPYLELGPLHGGFYLQLIVANRPMQAAPQTTPPTEDRPWTTVLSFYRLPQGRTIVMTWEAAPGAPRGLAARVAQVLSAYAAGSREKG